MKNISSLLFISFLIIVSSYSQTRPAPFHQLKFENYNPLFIHTSMDSSLVGNPNFDGRHHLMPLISPIEHEGFVYLITTFFWVDAEGALIEKMDAQTGEIVWRNGWDTRHSDRREMPLSARVNEDRQLEVFSLRMIDSLFDNFSHMIFGTLTTLSYRTFDLQTGAPLSVQYPSKAARNYGIHSTVPQYVLAEAGNYYHVYPQPNVDTSHYLCVRLDEHFNHTSDVKKINLNLPVGRGSLTYGGLKATPAGNFVTLDIKYLVTDLTDPIISLAIYDNEWRLIREMGDVIKGAMSVLPVYIRIDYADDNFIKVVLEDNDDNQELFVLNSSGDLLYKAHIANEMNSNFRHYTLAHWPVDSRTLFAASKGIKGPLEFFELNENGLSGKLKLYYDQDNLSFQPFEALLLTNNNLLVGGLQGKDTMLDDGVRRQYIQGTTWVAISGEDLDLSVSLKESADVQDGLTVYPNPVDKEAVVQFAQAATRNQRLVCSDVSGQLLKTWNVPEGAVSMELPLDDLPNGVYFLTLMEHTRPISTHKIVVLR